MGDFGLTRLPAVAAVGSATFSRYAPAGSATLLVGDTVRTVDGTLSFAVAADPANPLYVADTGGGIPGYLVPVGTASVTVPVACTTAGAVGNVLAGLVNSGVGIPGLNQVANAAPMAGGLDAESDDALRQRFRDYIASLERATVTAIREAIESVRQGLAYAVQENVDEQGVARLGHFVVTAAQADGTLPPDLETAIYAAVDRVRPICSTFSVQAPVLAYADVAMTITTDPPSAKVAAAAAAETAIATFVAGLTVGQPMAFNRLAVLAFGAAPVVTNVQAIRLNGGTDDLAPLPNGLVRLRVCSVS